MITVITGTPGAGKTLYAISKLIQPLLGAHVPVTDEKGVTTLHPRTVYTNINGLLLDHELIDGGENRGLRDWHTWCKPGDVIVFDEVQRFWKPRPNGSAVPPEIEALETHRHMGVDFILITQNVMLLDRNIHALCGRHLHVRRIANAKLAVVYEWDHASRNLLYSKSISKSPWRYDRKVFKLYRSAEAHTKQPRKMPGLVWFILAGLLGAAYLLPTMYGRLQARIGGDVPDAVVASAAESSSAPVLPVASNLGARSVAPGEAPVLPVEAAETFSGCARARDVCTCYTTKGAKVDKPASFCHSMTGPAAVDLAIGGSVDGLGAFRPVGVSALAAEDLEMLEWASRARRTAAPSPWVSPADVTAAYRSSGPLAPFNRLP